MGGLGRRDDLDHDSLEIIRAAAGETGLEHFVRCQATNPALPGEWLSGLTVWNPTDHTATALARYAQHAFPGNIDGAPC